MKLNCFHIPNFLFRSMREQDAHLMKARETVPSVLEEIVNFKVCLKTPVPELAQTDSQKQQGGFSETDTKEEQLYSEVVTSSKVQPSVSGTSPVESSLSTGINSSLNEIIETQKEALVQVTDVLEKLEKVEKLYPTLKALGNDYVLYSSESFQNKLNTLCLWSNITKDIATKLSLMASVLYVDNIQGLYWPSFDFESPSQNLNQIRDMPNTLTPTVSATHGDGLSSEEEGEVASSSLKVRVTKPQKSRTSFNDGLSSSSDIRACSHSTATMWSPVKLLPCTGYLRKQD